MRRLAEPLITVGQSQGNCSKTASGAAPCINCIKGPQDVRAGLMTVNGASVRVPTLARVGQLVQQLPV